MLLGCGKIATLQSFQTLLYVGLGIRWRALRPRRPGYGQQKAGTQIK
jgi:hypothetical protein